MKQKKIFYVVGLMILMISSVILFTSCGKKPSKYMGSYAGTFRTTAGVINNWMGSVDKDGNFALDGTGLYGITLKVSDRGVISGSGNGINFTGLITGDAVSGYMTGTVTGAFVGTKK